MKKTIYATFEDYEKYLSKYGNNRIDKNYILQTTGSNLPKFISKINEEIFEGIPNEYIFVEETNYRKLIKFHSKSGIAYRLDLLREFDSDIWHIAFSEFDRQMDNEYELLTGKQESIDVFSRLIWILKDMKMNVVYCIGSSSDARKNNIYMYMMRFVSNWEKRKTDYYDGGWGIYFEI